LEEEEGAGLIRMGWAPTARLRVARLEAMVREAEEAGDVGVGDAAAMSRCTCPAALVAVRKLGKPIVSLCTALQTRASSHIHIP
jgi:hypothetical protein